MFIPEKYSVIVPENLHRRDRYGVHFWRHPPPESGYPNIYDRKKKSVSVSIFCSDMYVQGRVVAFMDNRFQPQIDGSTVSSWQKGGLYPPAVLDEKRHHPTVFVPE